MFCMFLLISLAEKPRRRRSHTAIINDLTEKQNNEEYKSDQHRGSRDKKAHHIRHTEEGLQNPVENPNENINLVNQIPEDDSSHRKSGRSRKDRHSSRHSSNRHHRRKSSSDDQCNSDSDCHQNAKCTEGKCVCNEGYTGDGLNCDYLYNPYTMQIKELLKTYKIFIPIVVVLCLLIIWMCFRNRKKTKNEKVFQKHYLPVTLNKKLQPQNEEQGFNVHFEPLNSRG